MAITDNKQIYIAYFIGKNIETNKNDYTEPHIAYADVSEPISYENIDNIGRIPKYDRTLVFEVGEKTEFISEDSVLWIDTEPNQDADNFDYVVARVGDITNGQLKIYCNAVSPNTQFLYYSNDGENIYQVKVFYNNLEAIVSKNMYLPLNKDSLIWFIKPSSIESENARIVYVDTEKNYNTIIYHFKDYQEE